MKTIWIILWAILGIALIVIAIIFGYNMRNASVNNGSNNGCAVDSDCMTNSCCHPSGCVVKQDRVCNLLCTNVCEGPIDCGKGACGCVNGQCGVING